MDDSGPLAEIFSDIADEKYEWLWRHFCRPGRGRHTKTTPSMNVTNGHLLQLLLLKKKTHATWNKVRDWMADLHPHYPSHKVQHLIDITAARAIKCSFEDRQHFYESTIDLDHIGPYTDQLGLKRSNIRDPTEYPSNLTSLNIGAALEILNEVEGWSTLDLVMGVIHTNLCPRKELVNAVTRWRAWLRRNKKKTEAIKAYNGQSVCGDIMQHRSREYNRGQENTENSLEPQIPTIPSACSSQFQELALNTASNIAEEAEQLTHVSPILGCCLNLNQENHKTSPSTSDAAEPHPGPSHLSLDQRTNKYSEDLENLKNRLQERNKMTEDLHAEITSLKGNLNTAQSALNISEEKLSECQAIAGELKSELAAMKKDPEYKSLKRSLRYHKQTCKMLRHENQSATLGYRQEEMLSLKSKIEDSEKIMSSQRKQISRQNKQISKHKDRHKSITSVITSLKKETEELNVESMIWKEDKMSTQSDSQGRPYVDDIQKAVMELVGERGVSCENAGPVIACVAKWVFHKKVSIDNFPKATAVNTMVDKAHVLAKIQVAEKMLICGSWDLHQDGTTLDGSKIIGQQATFDSGETFSLGFNAVLSEDATTLLDNAIAMLEELAAMYAASQEERETTLKVFLEKMFALMSDRASVNKAFHTSMQEYRKEAIGTETDLHFLYCNAHFLLGLSNICEQVLRQLEKELPTLGRNQASKFKRFTSSSESSLARFIRTGCDVFGPRGDPKSGCRLQWEAFCQEKINEKSYITSFRMNRFNNFFQGAGALYYHADSICTFLTTCKESLNMKLESVLLDAQCDNILALVRAVGLIFHLVTGPFWKMLGSGVEYVDLHKYIQKMYFSFQEWSKDSSALLTSSDSIFAEFTMTNSLIYQELTINKDEELDNLTTKALEMIMAGFVTVTQRQLIDFLPGGKYSQDTTDEQRKAMAHCNVTNLISEYDFGDLDFSKYRRRSASMHYHSSIQMIKRNKTISTFLASKTAEEQHQLLQTATNKCADLRKTHMDAEQKIKSDLVKKMELAERNKMEKLARQDATRAKLLERVSHHGGPCICLHDIEKILQGKATKTARMEIIKDEMRYLKNILQIKSKDLLFVRKNCKELQESLERVLSSRSCKCNEDPEAEPAAKKRRIEPEETDYVFTEEDSWVAVAAGVEFFIGQVKVIRTENHAMVQFLKHGPNDIFSWPQVEDICQVDAKDVFASHFEVLEQDANSPKPTYIIPPLQYLQDLFESHPVSDL